jgi:ABC-type phosphate transport system substrate-binding protein
MRYFLALISTVFVTIAAVLAAAPAMADPPVVPKPPDIVGVGTALTANLFSQFSHDYNATHATGPRLYSFDATPPGNIVPKQGCAPIPRPTDSQGGINALLIPNYTTQGHPCIDFARSAVGQQPGGPGNISFVNLALDAVTWSTQAVTDAPANLTFQQLAAIYTCQVTNWAQVGGTSATIQAFLPQAGSETRSFFLKAINVAVPGPCVSDNGGTLQEDEGVNPALHSPEAIFPYSVGTYLAQRYHSAHCLNATCTPVNGVTCTPGNGQNLFGCDLHGTMALHMVNGRAPTVPFPLTNASKNAVINKLFNLPLLRPLFDVVRGAPGTIPAYLQPFFSHTGWVCANATAKTDIKHYGFLVNC